MSTITLKNLTINSDHSLCNELNKEAKKCNKYENDIWGNYHESHAFAQWCQMIPEEWYNCRLRLKIHSFHDCETLKWLEISTILCIFFGSYVIFNIFPSIYL